MNMDEKSDDLVNKLILPEDVEILKNDNRLKTTTENEEKPLLELLIQIIHRDVTINDSQLTEMLMKEFNINISEHHSLTADIYLAVLKKILKSWPQWADFQRLMLNAETKSNADEYRDTLDSQYKSFKVYLQALLNTCQPLAREAEEQVKMNKAAPETSGSRSVLLEINCSRQQLNSLFFRRPHPDFDNSIFNMNTPNPSRILGALSLKSILNWWHINVTINLECFRYKRELIHKLNHTLVNKKLEHTPKLMLLNRFLQVKEMNTRHSIMKTSLVQVLKKIIDVNTQHYEDQKENIKTIFNVIQEDVRLVTDVVNVPSSFRYYMNELPYVRYLYEDVESPNSASDKYDLQLEEQLSPRLAFHLTSISTMSKPDIMESSWLKIECVLCNMSFVGFSGLDNLKDHFNEVHRYEPDFTCNQCEQTFTVDYLALSRWHHRCV